MDDPDIMDLCRPHAGCWRGHYRHFDAEGALVDAHESEILNEFPAQGEFAYVQTSRFFWADGRHERHVFPGRLVANQLIWETERLRGVAFTSRHAPQAMFLRFARVDLPGIEILEMIEADHGAGIRMRSWQWRKDGQPFRRTIVDERRVW